jgi:hypothetical protein
VKTPVPVEDRGRDVAEELAGWVPREKLYHDCAKEEDYLAHVLKHKNFLVNRKLRMKRLGEESPALVIGIDIISKLSEAFLEI